MVRKATDLAIGGGVTLGLAALGLVFLYFASRSISLSLASDGWPTVPGVVVAAGVHEDRPAVTYRYEVDGRTLTSTRLGFDVFDQPGGRGSRDAILARYPVGADVTAHVRPGHPEFAVLETGDVYPFVMPLVFGGFFLAGAGLCVLRLVKGPLRLSPQGRLRAIAAVSSVMLAVGVTVALLDPAVQETFDQAFGSWVWGVAATAALFVPVPYVLLHVATAQQAGVPLTIGGMVSAARQGDRSARVVALGLAWFAVVCAAWIGWASWLGI